MLALLDFVRVGGELSNSLVDTVAKWAGIRHHKHPATVSHYLVAAVFFY